MFWRTLHLQRKRQAAHSKEQVPLQLWHLPTWIHVSHSKSMLSWKKETALTEGLLEVYVKLLELPISFSTAYASTDVMSD